jgi:hypothetical protein
MKSQNLKKQTDKYSRLKNYLALTAGLVAISPLADAQIIYTDVDPDSVLTDNESFQLDINNDGIFDYTIRQGSFYDGTIKYNINSFNGLKENQVLTVGHMSMSSMYYVPKPLNFWDDMIPSGYNKVWKQGGRLFCTGSKHLKNTGFWKGLQDKYVGLNFKINSNFYFGWARLEVDSTANSVTLKDYAYYNEAEKPIRAGSMKVSLPDDNTLKNIRVFLTEGSIRIEVPADQILTGKISLTDINGRELKTIDVKNEKNIQLNTQELPAGVYIVNTLTEKGSLNKKVLIR